MNQEKSFKGNICLILGFLSFIPLVHLASLVFSYFVFKAHRAGRARAAAGFILGAFFTIMYSLLLIGGFTYNKANYLPVHISTIDKHLSGHISEDLKEGLILTQEGKYLQALNQLSLIEDKESEAVKFALGVIYQQLGRPDKASESFIEVLGLAQDNKEALFHLGVINLRANQEDKFKKSEEYFKQFLLNNPQDPHTLNFLELLKNKVDWQGNVLVYILIAIVIVVSISFHEFAHSYIAFIHGDLSQKDSGRLSLNPLRHLDPFGSVILPTILILSKSQTIFAWAKPVVVNKQSFRNPDRDDMRVAFAGPGTNFTLAMIAAVINTSIALILIRLFPQMQTMNFFFPYSFSSVSGIPFAPAFIYLNMFLNLVIFTNLILGTFNLLPVPPLDGSWIISGILPLNLRLHYEKLRKFSFALVLILIFFRIIDIVLGVAVIPYYIFIHSVFAPVLGIN